METERHWTWTGLRTSHRPTRTKLDRGGTNRDTTAEQFCKNKRNQTCLPTNRPIFYWTNNDITHHSPMNPTVKKRIDFQVSQQQLKIHSASTANFLAREVSSRDLRGKFHKNSSVWIRARRTPGCYNASLINLPARFNSNIGAY